MKRNGITIAALAATAFVTACASGTTTVLAPNTSAERFAAAHIVQGAHTVEAPPEAVARFAESLQADLYKEGAFAEGDGLIVEYAFVQYDEGNRAARYIIGFGAGKAELTIAVTFKNAAGETVGNINVGGELMMGVLGGSSSQAVDRASMETAEYAVANFAD